MDMAMPAGGGGQFWEDTPMDEVEQAADKARAAPTPDLQTAKDSMKREKQQDDNDFIELKEKVKGAIAEQDMQQQATICVVPGELATGGNIDPYAPTVVCIGPLCAIWRGTDNMAKLERYKWCCVRKLIVGVGRPSAAAWKPDEHEPLLRMCLGRITSLLPPIRASYSIPSTAIIGENGVRLAKELLNDDPESGIDDQSSGLARNMLLDGCFVLHRLLKMARTAKRPDYVHEDEDDDWTQVYGRCGVWGLVTRDLLLLNNQIPLFVVQALVEQLKLEDDVLVDGGLRLFSSLHPRSRRPAGVGPLSRRGVHHLLHLFYLCITDLPIPTSEAEAEAELLLSSSSEALFTQWVPSARELEDAGVRFRARKETTLSSFLDIRFDARRGVLGIPPLQLYDYSEPLFRNLIALEQTNPDTPGHVTAYAIFMDCLVKTPDDMRLLHHHGILLNHMNGDHRDAATGFFSRLCAGAHTSASRNYLARLMAQVVTYQSGSWPQWRAALQRDYFRNPWAIIAFLAGAAVLAMTMLQTFYTVYPYYHPSK